MRTPEESARDCARGGAGSLALRYFLVAEQHHSLKEVMRFCTRVRRVRSKGAILVLIWNFLVAASYVMTASKVKFSDTLSTYEVVFYTLQALFTVVSLLLAGWLADVYFGRYKVMYVCIWVVWVSSVVGVVALIVQSVYPNPVLDYIVLLPKFLVAVWSAAYVANVLPFGTDQILDGSSDEISTFVNWCVWTWFAGYWVANLLHSSISSCVNLTTPITELFAVALLSLALCLDFFCQKWLVIEPESRNPLKTVLSVLKYAATHKHPVQRSAFTYCERDIPTRLNLGKSKYGGPFTTEQVEDVKTFLRILLVVTCAVTSITGIILLSLIPSSPQQHFYTPDYLSECSQVVAAAVYSWSAVASLCIPTYEFLIYPLTRKWMPSMLKRIGIGAVFTVILGVTMTVIDSVGHALTSTPVPCLFMINETAVLDINYLWVDVWSNVMIGLQFAIFATAAFEFICAQSPYSMKGLLSGLGWAIFLLALAVAVLLIVAWSEGWKEPYSTPSCGTFYYMFATLVSIAGLVAYIVVARWYKRREREEPANEQELIESVYDRYFT